MEKAAFVIYLAVLILSPLLFGAIHTYAYTIMSLGVLTGTLLLANKNVGKDPKRNGYQFSFPATSLNFVFFALLLFLILQTIPLPEFLLRLLSPEAKVIGMKSLPASGQSTTGGQISHWFSLSPYTYPVRMSIIRWTTYGLFFFGLVQLLNTRKRIEIAVFLILGVGCFEVLYGLLQTFSRANHIWWYKRHLEMASVSGTYMNRNHFAGLQEMCLILAAAYGAGLTGRQRKRGPADKSSLKAQLKGYLAGEQWFSKRFLVLFSGVVIGVGIILSASRTGLVGALCGLLCLSFLIIPRQGLRKKGLIILGLFLVSGIYALHLGAEYTLERFKYMDSGLLMRARYTQRTLEMFTDYSMTGVGVGNFQNAYPKYQAVQDKSLFIRHAHNDWAQFMAEAGIIGLILLLSGIAYYVYRTVRLWRRRRDSLAICLGAAPFAVMAAIAIHSFFDFNLHYPANFLMLTAITAIGYSSLHLRRRSHGEKPFFRYHVIPLRYGGIVPALFVLVLIVWTGFWTVRHFMAEVNCSTIYNPTLKRDHDPPVEEIRKAIQWDSGNAAYRYKLAKALTEIRNTKSRDSEMPDEVRNRRQMEIIRALEEAARLNPFQAEYHLRLGWEYMVLWRGPDPYRRWIPAADLSVDRAAYFAGTRDPDLHYMMGNYWLMRSKTIHPASPEWESACSRAVWHYKRNLSLESGPEQETIRQRIRENIRVHYADEAFIEQVVG